MIHTTGYHSDNISGYSSSSSGGLGRRNSSFNMGSPHSQQDSGNRSSYNSGSFGGLGKLLVSVGN